MRAKRLAIGLSLLLVSLLLVSSLLGACGPPPQSELMPTEPTCQCGGWSAGPQGIQEGNVWVKETWTPLSGGLAEGTVGWCDCGETVTLAPPGPGYSGTVKISSDLICEPDDCAVAYEHYVINPDGAYTIEEAGNSVDLTYGPPYGVYTVVLKATCNGTTCTPCTIFVDFESPSETCTWTGCGIINNATTSPTDIIPQTVIAFEECVGGVDYTLYGPSSLAEINSSATLSSDNDCKCARYCYIEEGGKKIIEKWEIVDDSCCVDCCLFCCDVDFSFIGSPVDGTGGWGLPSLCPGQILTYQYNLTNNSPYPLKYHFSNLTPSLQIDFFPNYGIVAANSGELIIVYYQMPGNLDDLCSQSSYTFTHLLNITINTGPLVAGLVECTPIESSVLVNCHNCPECEPKMHYQQYPDEGGWDVFSCDSLTPGEDIQAADDWECNESGLVTGIRFWGSWKDDDVGQITGFNVEIYSNSLAGGYSHPGDLLWDSFITGYGFGAVELAGYEGWYNPWQDLYDEHNNNTYYRYDIINIQDAFYQEVGNIYWLSIWPVIDGVGVWGWKSSENHWEDDACWRRFDSSPPGPWKELYEPILFVQSLDLAFVICGQEITPSISVEKMVSVDGGATWVDEVEQNVCQNVHFQITVTNDGDVPLSNIVISDYLPDCLEYVDGPAMEVYPTTSPPSYNMPGTDTPTWNCTSGLQPGASIDVTYTAHVVESGICKNQVSVEGEYDGVIVPGGASTVVIGITEQPPGQADWGDAPDPYPTLNANDGAHHLLNGPWLGSLRDGEPDGLPHPSALGDDNDGNDDEDGITFLTSVTTGQTVTINIVVSGGGGYVQAWIDWNSDGDWAHSAEQIFNDDLSDGTHTIYVAVPSNAVEGQTFARFRISIKGGLLPTFGADNGEVEDYEIRILGLRME